MPDRDFNLHTSVCCTRENCVRWCPGVYRKQLILKLTLQNQMRTQTAERLKPLQMMRETNKKGWHCVHCVFVREMEKAINTTATKYTKRKHIKYIKIKNTHINTGGAIISRQ